MDRKILIVDDEADIRDILQFNLENAGFAVETASSAEEALSVLSDRHSLILLDVMMGGISGFEMATKLREEGNMTPIIFLTAKDRQDDLLTGFAIWAPGSMVIKALVAMLFTCKRKKIMAPRNILMLVPAAVISIAGYYLYEVLITGSFVASLSGIPGSTIQAVASSLVFVVTGLTMDKFNIKETMMEDYNQ